MLVLPQDAVLRAAASVELEGLGLQRELTSGGAAGESLPENAVSTALLASLVSESTRVGVSAAPPGLLGGVATWRAPSGGDSGSDRPYSLDSMDKVAAGGPTTLEKLWAVVGTDPVLTKVRVGDGGWGGGFRVW